MSKPRTLEEMKNKKPSPLNLGDQENHVLKCGDGGDSQFIYLMPNKETHLWIKRNKIKTMIKWLQRAEAFLEESK